MFGTSNRSLGNRQNNMTLEGNTDAQFNSIRINPSKLENSIGGNNNLMIKGGPGGTDGGENDSLMYATNLPTGAREKTPLDKSGIRGHPNTTRPLGNILD